MVSHGMLHNALKSVERTPVSNKVAIYVPADSSANPFKDLQFEWVNHITGFMEKVFSEGSSTSDLLGYWKGEIEGVKYAHTFTNNTRNDSDLFKLAQLAAMMGEHMNQEAVLIEYFGEALLIRRKNYQKYYSGKTFAAVKKILDG